MAAKFSYAIWILTALFTRETEDFYRYIAKYVDKRFDTSGYSKDENRPIGKNKKSDRFGER